MKIFSEGERAARQRGIDKNQPGMVDSGVRGRCRDDITAGLGTRHRRLD